MNAAMGVCVLVLGGWVLPDATEEQTEENRLYQRPAAEGGAPQAEPGTRPTLPPPGMDPRQRRGATQPPPHQRTMPTAPTDPSAGGPASPWAQPHPGSSSAPYDARSNRSPAGGFARPSYNQSRSSRYDSTRDRASSYHSRSPFYSQAPSSTAQSSRHQAASRRVLGRGPKPFSNYRRPPVVSPYLNLFRDDNSQGTIDNYSTLVQPFIDQNYTNQNIRREIQSLESSSRTQGSDINRLNRDTQVLQGTAIPQYYRNYGDYYRRQGN